MLSRGQPPGFRLVGASAWAWRRFWPGQARRAKPGLVGRAVGPGLAEPWCMARAAGHPDSPDLAVCGDPKPGGTLVDGSVHPCCEPG